MLAGSSRMDQSWLETRFWLDSLRFEYTTISNELARTTDRQRSRLLRARASACVDDYLATLRQHETAKQAESQGCSSQPVTSRHYSP